ncbi:MAG: class I SAM-dependent methyltransferase [Chloroflexota bacterium]
MPESVPCALCGASELRPFFKGDAVESIVATPANDFNCTATASAVRNSLVRCANCGLVFASPRLTAAELAAKYRGMEDEAYLAELPSRRLTAAKNLNRIEAFAPRGRLLDIGCFTGTLLLEARRRGWEVLGIEPSDWGAKQALSAGLPVVHGTLDTAVIEEGSFDVVVMGDVIEHLPDPRLAVEVAARALRAGGLLWMNTPNIESPVSRLMGRHWYNFIAAHIYYFSPSTIRALVESAGLTVEWVGSYRRWFTVGYWLQRGGRYSPALAKGTRGVARKLGLEERPIPLDLGDHLQVFARKR